MSNTTPQQTSPGSPAVTPLSAEEQASLSTEAVALVKKWLEQASQRRPLR